MGDFPSVLDAPVGLVLEGDASDGVGAVEFQGVALWCVRGAVLVELPLMVPGQPDLHSTVLALALEGVLDRALAQDLVACVVVAEAL